MPAGGGPWGLFRILTGTAPVVFPGAVEVAAVEQAARTELKIKMRIRQITTG